MSGIALNATGERVTPVAGYPLPPALTAFEPRFDHLGRYKLPNVRTGAANTPYSRATTIAKTLEDTYNLNMWIVRNTIEGLVGSLDLIAQAQAAGNDKAALEAVATAAQQANGTAHAAEFGTTIHEWSAAVDAGTISLDDVPDPFREYVEHYRAICARHALRPRMIERIVYNPTAGAVGTLDRIFELADGSWCIGDVKTSKTLQYSYLSFVIQLAIYAGATHMLSEDGSTWEPMPEVRQDFAVLVHIPSDEPSRAAAVTFDLESGRGALNAALNVRAMRTAAPSVAGKHTIPFVDAAEQRRRDRRAEAREAVIYATNTTDLALAWDEYQDVWSDDLTTLGHKRAEEFAQEKEKA